MMSDAQKKVSVIVPVFNTERYLRQCLDSLVAQTLAGLDVVVVDDGSTDASPDIIAEYARNHPETFRVVRKTNGGRSDARNYGLAAAVGEFVGFVDSDDYVEPLMFSLLYQCALATGAEIAVCKFTGFDSDTGECRGTYDEGAPSEYGARLADHPGLLVHTDSSVCNKLFARRLFTEPETFPVGLGFEDVAVTFALLARATRIEKVDEYLYCYRRDREQSIMSSYGEHYNELAQALAIAYAHFAADGVFETFRPQLEELSINELILGRYADLFMHAPATIASSYVDCVFDHLGKYFPGWQQGQVIRRIARNRWQLAISTNPLLLKMYAALPPRVAAFLGRRLRMFSVCAA